MTPDDPLLALIAARNPVPDPDALTADELASADALRVRIQNAEPPRRSARGWSRQTRSILIAAAGILPAVVVLVIALGVRGPARPGSHGPNTLIPSVVLPQPGAPQTLLLIGSDHRAGEPYRDANTDTIVLVRLNASSSTINLLSIPRDLQVQIPEGGTTVTGKLNAAYSVGGPGLLLAILQTQVFPGQHFHVNHVIDVNFAGFSNLIDAIGSVYADVDHRYYNNTALTGYSSIDIQPGYQKLCGDNQSDTGALAFLRFRHTDSDTVRQARAQDFIRWARQNYSGSQLFANRDKLLRIFGRYAQTDDSLHSADAIENLVVLVATSAGHELQSIPFPSQIQPCGGGNGQTACYLTAARGPEAAAYRAFMTPTIGGTGPNPPAAAPSDRAVRDSGPVADAADGQAQAAALSGSGMPVAYPAVIVAHSAYCSSSAGNCDDTSQPASAYAGAYPRAYRITAPDGRSYPAYRMTLVVNPALGEYYGVQGTTWTRPPILKSPTRTQQVDGKPLLEYYNGARLSVVAWKTAAAVYWISNTLTDSIPSDQLIAIAASLRVAT